MSPADKISLNFSSIKIFRIFCQKEEDLALLFHKMLESLLYDRSEEIRARAGVENISRKIREARLR